MARCVRRGGRYEVRHEDGRLDSRHSSRGPCEAKAEKLRAAASRGDGGATLGERLDPRSTEAMYSAKGGGGRGRGGRGSRSRRRARRGRASEAAGALKINELSPTSYRARLGRLGQADLARDQDTILSHLKRLSRAREARSGIEALGRGWSGLELAATLDAVRVARSRATEQQELGAGDSPSMEERQPRDHVYPSKEGGIHGHTLDDAGAAALGGRHGHAILYRGSIWFTEVDGAHAHEAGEEGRVGDEDEHDHVLFLDVDGEAKEITLTGATPHSHEALVGTTVVDGVHQHAAEIEGRTVMTLMPEEFRELFGAVESLQFSGSAREAAGQGATPTSGLSFVDWWSKGYGSPGVRRFLAPWLLSSAVSESRAEGGAVHMKLPADEVREDTRFLVVAGSPQAEMVEQLSGDEGLDEARLAAAMSLSLDRRPRVSILERTFESGADGKEACEQVCHLELSKEAPDEAKIEQSVLMRACESMVAPHIGRVVEANVELERAWEIRVMEFGISDNDNFWPRSLGEKLLRVLEGAPLEAIEYRPHHFDHLPLDAVLRFPKGIVMNTVGQAQKLRLVESGGRAPTGAKLQAIMDRMGMTEEEVQAESSGTIVGLAILDGDERGTAIHEKLRSAEARGRLTDYLGLSVDFQEAPFIPMFVPGMRRPLVVRTDINEDQRRSITFVTHPSAGGSVEAAA